MIWNVYFGALALFLGFFATFLAISKKVNFVWNRASHAFVFLFRGSPLFIQFFLAYEAFVLLPKVGIIIDLGFVVIDAQTRWLTKAWLGALIVLFCNTSAYSAEIFYGALRGVPKGDIEAADAYGFSGWRKFKSIIWPSMLRLAWPAYPMKLFLCFMQRPWSFSLAFQLGANLVTRFIMQIILQIKPLIPLSLIRLWQCILSYGRCW